MKQLAIMILGSLLLSATQAGAQESAVMFLNTGTLNVEGSTTARTALYIQGDMMGAGASNIYVQKANMKLTGDLINHSDDGFHVFAGDESETNFVAKTDGSFEFAGTSPQQIRGIAGKAGSFIRFPQTSVINNTNATDWKQATVTLVPTAAATMTNLQHKSGRLVIDSETGMDFNTNNAHLILKGTASGTMYYDNTNPAGPWGHVQVNLALGANQGKRIFGFASPFSRTYADYFMYNFLSAPSSKGLFGDNGLLITNPATFVEKGKGYIVGQGLVDEAAYYSGMLDPEWAGAKYADRATTVFHFGGFPYYGAASIQVKTTAERYAAEVLNSSDIPLTLSKGFNYLGNSFTAPLDLKSLVEKEGVADSDWGVTVGPAATADVKNGFYVLTNGSGAYEGNNRFSFAASWLIGQKVGGTYTGSAGNYDNQNLIAPMQMFVLWSNKENVSLKIPAAKRTHGIVDFLRAAETESGPTDEILLESRDTRTGGFDRFCVVFRPDASEAATDPYDAPKLFNRSGGVNQLYTRSSDNKEMTTTVIPPTTYRIPLYFEPSLEIQEVELEASRLESLQSVQEVILEDTQTGKKSSLMRNAVYRFTSSPGDSPARFVLHFRNTATGMEAIEEKAFTASYRNGITSVYGLDEADRGEYLYLYNVKGELLYREKVTELFPQRIRKALTTGVYILRTEKGRTTKLSVK
ncbi:hypothetical protein M2463_002992 [Parabacteroides sp. PH5-13]|uniref:hypothetical protein n=1 Tax=unclassified Parabacteroides TaxID=2649774 RepID=UPI002473A6D2|nr:MULTISPECIES: hypothetical protein [unclassified Parabacteroides]MDH6306318.1 hypothetical protein [Parabacteroides sp. PH5-39]MDH6320960.1 hypothetical protein [Parabacteroides sp. PH5-13]MDH6324692.1 hypothetical protein [Parabacteroides sp. PH5-8]MDH6385873.1 hypothetical protein [Parabacteroides sp. PH5-17]MDH6395160.1 hypothetical protein [Parabacteroides sp. PFB2-22]